MDTTDIPSGGRQAANLAHWLRQRMAEGQVRAGEFLPGERELAAEHGVARKTVASAMASFVRMPPPCLPRPISTSHVIVHNDHER